MAGSAAGEAAGCAAVISPEEVLRQLVDEHGDNRFMFRRSNFERSGEWITSAPGNDSEGEGCIRDVKSKKR